MVHSSDSIFLTITASSSCSRVEGRGGEVGAAVK